MIVFVGNEIMLGGLIEVARHRLKEKVVCISENFDITKQENDILLNSAGASYIVYDTERYLNDAEEIIKIVKRIYRANNAKPILLIPTDNPKNAIIKCAVENQLKLFVNTALSMGDQKDQLEKIIAGFYEGNKSELVEAAEAAVEEDNQEIKAFVTDLYDAKQREEERENTVIINQKGTTEVLITSGVRFFKGIITIIVFILAAIGLSTLIYPDIRAAFMIEFSHVLDVLKSIL